MGMAKKRVNSTMAGARKAYGIVRTPYAAPARRPYAAMDDLPRLLAETVKPFFFMSSTVVVCMCPDAAVKAVLSVIAASKASL